MKLLKQLALQLFKPYRTRGGRLLLSFVVTGETFNSTTLLR